MPLCRLTADGRLTNLMGTIIFIVVLAVVALQARPDLGSDAGKVSFL